MPKQHVEALIDRMKSDAAFRARILAIEEVDARMKIIESEGFECKKDDMQLYLENDLGKDGSQVVVLTDRGGCKGIYYGFCF